jgi:small-conductance mechanosensitive channel
MEELTFNTVIFNNSIGNYLRALLIIFAVYIFLKFFDRIILKRIKIIVKKYSKSFCELLEDIIDKRVYPLVYFLTFYFIFKQLKTVTFLDNIIRIFLIIFTVFYSVLVLQDVLSYLIKKYWDKKQRSDEQQKLLSIILLLFKIILWSIALLFVLDNLNIQITGLITGLGIGGIAVAFAAQNILNDLFNYFTIYFDKPFDVGDFVIVGDYKGNIEHIGIKTTRIRSLSGEQLIISNTDLVNSRVNNYKRMEKRRINFSFGVTYNTPLEKLKKIPVIIEEIIKENEKTEFARAHFSEYADFSLVFQAVYYVLDSDYTVYMDIQQQINFKLRERFDELGVEFAFPTRTIYLNENKNKINDQNNNDFVNNSRENNS